ncbi:ABC transporter ATP-binding protein [Microbacterium sediminis]|uniref:ABC transporter ATP-binding protein n=1 Tax=Microbacterium sediminis TaxID=904291 RepID=A0A1B9NFD2_9MICO|nr:ABC transporter ATP-binding protein [Microbacterium sediminis]OCG75290.1 ABC transporter ATP-binding protein [Microbacterium sediminis]QBR74311.1 ABC transporter ATP-binding protein [Microbacterium sediminis]
MSALSVRGLSVSLPGTGPVLRDVSLHVDAGECLAIVGESGAGKSVLARTLLGLTHDVPGARVTASELSIAGRDLTRLGRRGRRALRGRDVALVLQDALQSLDPLRTIEAEVGEALALRGVPRGERRRRVIAAMAEAGLPDAEALLARRSGELSGGMRQRALIASATVGGAGLLVADEPTTALDATTAVRVLDLLARLRDEGRALVLISHDLRAVARVADRIAVLDAGRVVEDGAARQVLTAPRHEATRALLAAVPTGPKPGAATAAGAAPTPADADAHPGDPLIAAREVTRRYRDVTAVDDVSIDVRRGEVLGIVGESGSGKSTLARLLIGAERPDAGEVRRAASCVRLVPQDPLGSFDPRHSVERILRLSRRGDAPEPAELLRQVGLDAALLRRRPASLSGGQRQRVAIARALAAQPDVLVCDEPVSALDVTTQAGILDLLLSLQRERGLTMVFISHDLSVVRRVSDRVGVMRDGRIVEAGPTERIYAAPTDPFTAELIAAGA